MNLIAILLGTVVAGVGSVWLAAALSFGALARYMQHMLSLAAGALLATAFVHLLPEAFESGARPQALFLTILGGLVFFFLLDKAELWHHGHEHDPALPTLDEAMSAPDRPLAAGQDGHRHDGHAHGHAGHVHGPAAHGHGHQHRGAGGWSVLTGDSVHCFGDGVLIASAFMADLRLGALASVAVLAHEVPHHMGDLAVLRQTGADGRRTALTKVSLAGAVTALGGLAGYWFLGQFAGWLPYFVALASSSFIYVALADLIPQLQKRLPGKQTAAQLLWLVLGMGLVAGMGALSHDLGHGAHDHAHGAPTGVPGHDDHDDHDGDHAGHEHAAPAAAQARPDAPAPDASAPASVDPHDGHRH